MSLCGSRGFRSLKASLERSSFWLVVDIDSLCVGVWSLLKQQKQRLESVLDIWSGFVSKKISFEEFLNKSENSIETLLSALKTSTNVEDMQQALVELNVSEERERE